MQLEIITPEAKIFNAKIEAVRLPGKEGSFQVLNGHAPLISTLKAGEVKIDLSASAKEGAELHEFLSVDSKDKSILRLNIKGGVVEVQKEKVILLAD